MTIDYVVPMVFPDDLKWRHDYATANGCFRDDRSALTNVRYRSWGTEHLLIQCVRKHLPWIRNVVILLARKSQVQPWMLEEIAATKNGMPHIRIVFHNEFMPKDVLPTFNSRAIEMYLHRIPDLAPYFLYGNDDMFPIAPMPVEDFYRDGSVLAGFASGILPCLHYTHKTFSPSNAFHQACVNGLNFVAATVQSAGVVASAPTPFPSRFTDYWLRIGHNVVPMVKATCELFWQRWPKQMQASVTRFRMPHNFNQYIYSWHHILSGQYIDHRAPRTYLSVDADFNDIIQAIRTADGLLCINDNNSVNDITNLAATIRSEIQKRL